MDLNEVMSAVCYPSSLNFFSFFLFLLSFFKHMILPGCQRYKFVHRVAFSISSSFQVLPLDVTTRRDTYAWTYRELATLLTLSESLAETGLEPLNIGSMRKNLTIELSFAECKVSSLRSAGSHRGCSDGPPRIDRRAMHVHVLRHLYPLYICILHKCIPTIGHI